MVPPTIPLSPSFIFSVCEEQLSEENSSAMQSFSCCLLFIFHTCTFIDFLPSLSSASSPLISAAHFSPSFFPIATEESQKMAILEHSPIIGGKHICFWFLSEMYDVRFSLNWEQTYQGSLCHTVKFTCSLLCLSHGTQNHIFTFSMLSLS